MIRNKGMVEHILSQKLQLLKELILMVSYLARYLSITTLASMKVIGKTINIMVRASFISIMVVQLKEHGGMDSLYNRL